MKHRVTLLPGEGIGPEVSAAVRRILDATGVSVRRVPATPEVLFEAIESAGGAHVG